MKKIILIVGLFLTVLPLQAQNKNPLALTQGLNAFAFDSYKMLAHEKNGHNIVFSPYSLSSLLTILSQGAANGTLKQINKALHLPEDEPNILSQLGQINKSFVGTPTCKNKIGCFFKKITYSFGFSKRKALLIGNAIWIDKNMPLNGDFLTKLNNVSGINVYQIDFKNNPEASRKALNNWVEKKTNGLIDNLFFPGTIFSSTRIVLGNAIYFKAPWAKPFDASETQSMPFNPVDGSQVTKIDVPMMHQPKATYSYFENNGFQMAILPYSNNQLAMAIILPKANSNLQKIMQTMTSDTFETAVNQSFEKNFDLYLPKFNFESAYYDLSHTLQAMGIKDAFTDRANFTRLSADSLVISEVIQKATINTDESGTTAAAASGVVLMGSAASSKPLIFKADHPFLFIIFDRSTHVIYFIGHILNPSL